MRIKEIYRVLVIILGMILFFHIFLTSPVYEYYKFHTFVNLGIVFLNLFGEIVIVAKERGAL
tara:strand:- start:2944 stop:3129 length:186 start_codon:yes stop_codon:yes gene_type:complete